MDPQPHTPQPLTVPRRTALAGVTATAVGILAACTHGKKSSDRPTGTAAPDKTSAPSGGTPTADPSAATAPAPALLSAAIDRELALLAAYAAALRSVPAAAVLEDFGAHHREHLARLRTLAGSSESPAGGSSSPAGSTASGKPAPSAVRALFAALAVEETAAADAGALASATAGPSGFAEVLAEIAGSEAQHAALLPGFPIPATA